MNETKCPNSKTDGVGERRRGNVSITYSIHAGTKISNVPNEFQGVFGRHWISIDLVSMTLEKGFESS